MAVRGFDIVESASRGWPHPCLARHRHHATTACASSPTRGPPAEPPPVHHLHALRAAPDHHHVPLPVRPWGEHHHGQASRCAPGLHGGSTRTRATGASTPSPIACPDCGPRLRFTPGGRQRPRRRSRGDEALAAARPDAGGRRDRRRQGKSAATTWPVTPPTGPGGGYTLRASERTRRQTVRGDVCVDLTVARRASRRSAQQGPGTRRAHQRPPASHRAAAAGTARRGHALLADAVCPGSPQGGGHAAVHAGAPSCCSDCPPTRPAPVMCW